MNPHPAESTPTSQETIRQLESFIASVPAQVSVSSTRRMLFYGVGVFLVGAFLMFGASRVPEPGAAAFLLVTLIFLFGIGLVVSHWNEGKSPFMTLTHDHIEVFNLSAPIALKDIRDIQVTEGYLVGITFDLDPQTPLPQARRVRGIFQTQAVIVRGRNKPPRLVVQSAAMRVDGKVLDNRQVLSLLATYFNVSKARAQLAQLREQG